MDLKEYHDLLVEIANIETEVSSIAECKKLLHELDERENALEVIRENLIRDIRSIESHYLQEKVAIRQKYEDKGARPGLMDKLKTPFGSSKIKEMKKLEKEKEEVLQQYYEIRDMVDYLMEKMKDTRTPVNNLIKEKLGNF